MKKLAFFVFILITGALFIACQGGNSGADGNAVLTGKVTIGPINPVEIPGQPVIVNPEVFSARKIVVYDASGKKFVAQASITQIGQSASGTYSVSLAAGTYTVDINRLGIDNAFGLPKKITLAAGQKLTLDIDIDTGIR